MENEIWGSSWKIDIFNNYLVKLKSKKSFVYRCYSFLWFSSVQQILFLPNRFRLQTDFPSQFCVFLIFIYNHWAWHKDRFSRKYFKKSKSLLAFRKTIAGSDNLIENNFFLGKFEFKVTVHYWATGKMHPVVIP